MNLVVTLPLNFEVTTNEDFFDVKIGAVGGTRHLEEYRRMVEEKCFSRRTSRSGQILQMSVKNPRVGLLYCIKWIPPREGRAKSQKALLPKKASPR